MTSPRNSLFRLALSAGFLAALWTALPCAPALTAQGQAQNGSDANPRRTPVVRVVQESGPAVVSIISALPAAQTPFSGNDQLQRFLGLPASKHQPPLRML